MTIKEWLDQLATSDTSTDEDSRSMQYILRKGVRVSETDTIKLPQAKVILGVVYPEGHGRPVSIQAMARALVTPN